ncbi:MAG: sterol desaturase family protein [Steroidobacteraceae bacterium]|nr:sterol desaturase family protein [Steroidobacteraceae bacterium]
MTQGPDPTPIERWLARALGDDAPRHFGTGWISGVLAVFLGATALGAVIVLHFPDWLTSAELRARYPLPLVRTLIGLVIGFAFLASCLNLLLRRRKALGLAGLALTLAAVILGGTEVEIRGDFTRPYHFGLDWFLLNLLVFALVFVPLERAFPLHPGQRTLRAGWTTDLAYFFVSHVGIQLLAFLSLWPAAALTPWLGLGQVATRIASQPVWLQVLELMLLTDLVQYWVHRAFHRLPRLWRFHAIHHSSREMDWLAGSRLHLVDVVVTRALVVVPAFVLGFAEPALYAWLIVIALHAVFNHVNLRFRLRFLEHWLVTPRFHHWHHAVTPPDRNFAVHFPWLDRLFGTHYLPEGRWPEELGIRGHPVPDGFGAQFVYPLRRG